MRPMGSRRTVWCGCNKHEEGRIGGFITKIRCGQWGKMKADWWPQACVLVRVTVYWCLPCLEQFYLVRSRDNKNKTLPTWKPKSSQPSQEILTGFSALLIEMLHRGSLWVHLFWVSTLVIINSHIQFCMHQLIEILLKADAKETTKDIIHMYGFLYCYKL